MKGEGENPETDEMLTTRAPSAGEPGASKNGSISYTDMFRNEIETANKEEESSWN